MKKVFSLLLIMLLICCAFEGNAEPIDLSGLSFEELAALRDRCLQEMMTRDQWQQVTVPQGLWQVGTQIPAGTWTVRCSDNDRNGYLLQECFIRWGEGKPDGNGFWSYSDGRGSIEIYNPNSEHYKQGRVTVAYITIEDGQFLLIDPNYNTVVFEPYTGAPDLGFK